MKGEGLELLWRMLMAGCAGPWQFAEKWCHCLWVLVSERGELVGSHIGKVTTRRLCSPTSAPSVYQGLVYATATLKGEQKENARIFFLLPVFPLTPPYLSSLSFFSLSSSYFPFFKVDMHWFHWQCVKKESKKHVYFREQVRKNKV